MNIQKWWALENVCPFRFGVSFGIYVTFRGCKRTRCLLSGASTFVRCFWWDFWQKNYGWLLTIWLDFTWMVDKKVLGLVLSNFARFETHSPLQRTILHATSPCINEVSLGVSTKNHYPSDFRSRSCFFGNAARWGTAAVNACGNAGRWEQALQLVEDLRWDAWDEAVDGKQRKSQGQQENHRLDGAKSW